ncbi:glycine betaine ABC transporter substrate-binding protein OsmF [Salinarimonas soli]|uniref:ABC transporter substrate-binding protein n=1 Tax=Salinarimonas soli TaxID=1638099 RepID=A0A5B2VF12_9HYPH|nr:ABC transporter substrate-binding protein [Salinarimonas soli]KAA2236899.1 ABC transporter substrate-binding protein [Salinarimonas soli]
MRLPSTSRRRALALILGLVAGLPGIGPALAQGAAPERVRVASKIDTEGALLGNMIVLVLENLGIPVENRVSLGPTKIVRTALVSGEIDVYPEYTGNGAFFFDREADPVWKGAQSAYDTVKRLDAEANKLVWLDRAPANNTWLVAVRADAAKRANLKTMEDFAKAAGSMRLAASAEFVESAAALPSFEKAYGFTMPRDRIVVLPGGDTSVTMRAAAQGIGGVDSAMVYGTDGAIAALDLVVMTDTKGAQIVYEPAPVVRAAVLERHPAMGPALSRVFGSLDLRTLQELNAKIAVEGRPARDVAGAYLRDKGLLR